MYGRELQSRRSNNIIKTLQRNELDHFEGKLYQSIKILHYLLLCVNKDVAKAEEIELEN